MWPPIDASPAARATARASSARRRAVAGSPASEAARGQVEQRGGEQARGADGPPRRQGLLEERAPGRGGVLEVPEHLLQRLQRAAEELPVAARPGQRDALLQERAGPPDVPGLVFQAPRRGQRRHPGGGRAGAGSGERAGQPGAALADGLAHGPEPAERGGEPELPLGPVRVLLPPLERGPQVVVLGLQPLEPDRLVTALQLRGGPLGQGQAPVAVPPARRRPLARLGQLLAGVLPERLQQPVPHAAARPVVGDHERLVHQARTGGRARLAGGGADPEPVPPREVLGAGIGLRPSAREPVGQVVGADRLGRLQRPAAGEHRQAPEQRPLGRGQEVVAPVDRRRQRLLAGQGGADCRRSAGGSDRPAARRSAPGAARARGRRPARGPGAGRPAGGTPAPPPPRSAGSGRSPAGPGGPARRTAAPHRRRRADRSAAGRAGRERRARARGRPPRPRRARAPGWWPARAGRDRPAAGRRPAAAQASTRCSQLSSTSRSARVRRCSVSVARWGRPGSSRRPSATSAVWGTSAGSARGASSTSQTPSG